MAVSNETIKALGLEADAIGMDSDARAKRAAGNAALIAAARPARTR